MDNTNPISVLEPALDRLRDELLAFLAFLPLLILALVVVALFVALAGWMGRWRLPSRWSAENPFVRNLLRTLLQAMTVLVGTLLALEILGLTALVGAVLGTAGVMGLVLGFAFRDIVENYLAGIILSLRQPFAPNDLVAMEGHEGKVVRLTSRETVLMTLDGNHVRIPNALVFKSSMVNFTRNPRRRFTVLVSVASNEPLAPVLTLGEKIVSGVPGVISQPPVRGRIHDLSASGAVLRFRGWVDQTVSDFEAVRSEAIRLVLEGFDSSGIPLPPPEYRISMTQGSAKGIPQSATDSGQRTPTAPPTIPPDEGRAAAAQAQVVADVSREDDLDDQIREDRATSGEQNLLTAEGPAGSALEGR
ncbi:MAG: mechanosensitive ion channel domain-containing protein [Gemmatimonadota bacterium]